MVHDVDPNVLGAIFFGYIIIGGFLFRGAWRAGRSARGMARGSLGAVFILCSFSGYGAEFFSGHLDLWWLAGAARLAHWLLLAVLISLIVLLVMGVDVFGDKDRASPRRYPNGKF